LACQNTRALDLGCGSSPKNPFQASSLQGVDIRPQPGTDIVRSDLFNHPIPFEDENFDFVTAFDFIEHVPRTVCERGCTRFPFVQLMNEVSRVLKPGGLFLSSTPAYPSQQTFQDPTHVNPITENTFPFYFCSREGDLPWARMYGFGGSFDLVSQAWSGYSLLTIMKKTA
jgi:SAM-dependent methyltransferase